MFKVICFSLQLVLQRSISSYKIRVINSTFLIVTKTEGLSIVLNNYGYFELPEEIGDV